MSRAQDDFFGIGNNTPEDETKFRTVTRQASAGFTAKWNERWTSGFGVTYRSVGVTEPTSGVSTQDQFNAASVPGLFGATLGSAGFFVTRDTENRDNYSFKGGSTFKSASIGVLMEATSNTGDTISIRSISFG